MKASLATLAASLGALMLPGLAQAGTVRLDHLAARVVVVPEDRANITAEVRGGSGKVARPVLHVSGADITVTGNLTEGQMRDCHSTRSGGIKFGWFAPSYQASDLPVVTIRTPRDVVVVADGAIVGQIGPANSVDLFQKHCGGWTVGDVADRFMLRLEGRADVDAGAVGRAEFDLDGLGDVKVHSAGSIKGQMNGLGDLTFGSVNGPVDVTLDGLGDIRIRGGHATSFRARLAGMGDIHFNGTADSVDASADGMGDITVAHATGSVRKSISGLASIKVGK